MMKVIRMVLAAGVVLLAGAAVKSALDVVDVSPVSPSDATSPGPVAAKPQFIVPPLDANERDAGAATVRCDAAARR